MGQLRFWRWAFYSPNGISADSSGNIYVVDMATHRYQKFSSSGTYLSQWGTNGSGNNQFLYPSNIFIDDSNNVYITDQQNHRIKKTDTNGTFITAWGTEGEGNGEFGLICGICINSFGNIYVTDEARSCVQKFSSGWCISIVYGVAMAQVMGNLIILKYLY
jgi:DNA-binding beta-propeller fold protein YncE